MSQSRSREPEATTPQRVGLLLRAYALLAQAGRRLRAIPSLYHGASVALAEQCEGHAAACYKAAGAIVDCRHFVLTCARHEDGPLCWGRLICPVEAEPLRWLCEGHYGEEIEGAYQQPRLVVSRAMRARRAPDGPGDADALADEGRG